MPTQRTMRSVLNTLRVLEAIDPKNPAGLSEFARQVNLPKTTVHRIFVTLQAGGWLAASETAPTRWTPSAKMRAVASRLYQTWDLRTASLQVMTALRDATKETVTLSILVPDSRFTILVDKVDSPLPVAATSNIGSLIPIHASSGGKAILSQLPADEVKGLVGRKLEKFTNRTVVDRDKLLADLRVARKQGYALSREEWRAEIVGVGTAIVNASGRPVAAISLLLPTSRCAGRRIEELGSMVRAAVASIDVRDGS